MKAAAKANAFDLKVEFDRETDGRWIADIPALPGVMVYGRTRKRALAGVEALALCNCRPFGTWGSSARRHDVTLSSPYISTASQLPRNP
jgi:hypothetical protein